MIKKISHTRQDETPEAKARWFQSLSLQERMEIFNAYTEMILTLNPDIVKKKHVRPSARVCVLTLEK